MASAMTTPATTPNIMQQLAEGSNPPAQSQTPNAAPNAPTGNIFQQLAEGTYKDPNASTKPELTADEQASRTRQMALSGMTFGMPTASMTDQDKQELAQGKAAGAISVPVVAGSYLAAHAALTAGIPPLMKALTGGAVALGAWASEHPMAAKIIFHSIKAAITGTAIGAGAKIAGKVIDAAP